MDAAEGGHAAATEPAGGSEFTVYRRRWLVLALYALFCVCNSMQWLQYAIITDVIVKYYGVGTSAVNWTSLVWMIVYVVLIFPATWLLNNKGLRFVIILGQAFNCVGAWIKVGSVSPDLFWVTFLGQTVVCMAQVYVMSTPAPVAATWFGPKQVSTATAIGVFGVMVGDALGSLLPPLIVPNGTTEEIGRGLAIMFYSIAIFATVLLVLLIVFLKDAPPTPPSAAQANRVGAGVDVGGETPRQFLAALVRVCRNPNFLLLFVVYGTCVGAFSALLTFLNQMILVHYPDGQVFAGNVGVTIIVVGAVGTLFCGYVLDLTRKYKEVCLALYALSCLGCVGYTLLLNAASDTVYIYLLSAFIGFFIVGYIPSGYEFGAELTYPESEATSACVLAISGQLFAFIFTLVYGAIYDAHGDAASNWTLCGALALGTALSAFNKSDLRRQRAENEGNLETTTLKQ